jgi:hypothetical protein
MEHLATPAFFASFDEGHAVQYFYEPFLHAFDPELRKELERVKREILRLTAGADITSLRPDFGDADTITDEETLT